MGERGGARKNREEKIKRINRLLSELQRRELTIEQVAAFLGVVPRTAKNMVAELRLAGKIEVDGQTVRLPRQAAQETHQEAHTGAVFGTLDETINLLPTEGHKAFFRLLLGAMVARFHLGEALKDGWPVAIIYGDTASFKTALAVVLAHAFGRKEETIIRPIGRETARSLLGRRVAAGKGKISFQPADYLAEPLLCLDECDKANDDIRKHILLLAQGDSVMEIEGFKFTMKATPLLTFNADSITGWLHRAYLRRSFTLDTTKNFDRRAINKAASAIFDNVPKVSLTSLRPLAKSVPNELIAELNNHCAKFLTDEGIKLFDARYISKCSPGYTGLGRMSLQRAILHVGKDYLTVTSTLGRVKGGYVEYFDHLLAGLPAESLPAVIEEPDIEEEPEGYSLADLCQCWLDGYANGIISGIKQGESEYTAVMLQGKWPIQTQGDGITDVKKPEPEYVLSDVLHILSMSHSMAQGKRFDDNTMRTAFSKAETQGWHAGKRMGWNRYRECNERQANGNSCPYAWWKHCTSCKQRQKYLEWQKRRLSSGKNAIALQRRGDTWER